MHHGVVQARPRQNAREPILVPSKRLVLNIDQGDAEIGTLFTPEALDRFPNDDLEGRPHDTRREVTAANAAIAQSQYGMEMQARLEIIAFRNIAHQTEHLALLVDGDRLVALGIWIKPA